MWQADSVGVETSPKHLTNKQTNNDEEYPGGVKTDSDFVELQDILIKVLKADERVDGSVELYLFLQSHPKVDVYTFVSESLGWKQIRRKDNPELKDVNLNDFLSECLEEGREEHEYILNDQDQQLDFKEDADQDDQLKVVQDSDQQDWPESNHCDEVETSIGTASVFSEKRQRRYVLFHKLGRLATFSSSDKRNKVDHEVDVEDSVEDNIGDKVAEAVEVVYNLPDPGNEESWNKSVSLGCEYSSSEPGMVTVSHVEVDEETEVNFLEPGNVSSEDSSLEPGNASVSHFEVDMETEDNILEPGNESNTTKIKYQTQSYVADKVSSTQLVNGKYTRKAVRWRSKSDRERRKQRLLAYQQKIMELKGLPSSQLLQLTPNTVPDDLSTGQRRQNFINKFE